jgi:hypothetical protein
MASAFATAGFTLYIEPVYVAVDSIMGGRNLAGLILSLSILAAFSQLHGAVTRAAGASEISSPTHAAVPLGNAKLLDTRISDSYSWILDERPSITSPSDPYLWIPTGHDAFLLAASSFIAYTSAASSEFLSVIFDKCPLPSGSASSRLRRLPGCHFLLLDLSATCGRPKESFSPYYGVGQGWPLSALHRPFNLAFGWHRTHCLLRHRRQVALAPDVSSVASSH